MLEEKPTSPWQESGTGNNVIGRLSFAVSNATNITLKMSGHDYIVPHVLLLPQRVAKWKSSRLLWS